jgi:hypothetical protein
MGLVIQAISRWLMLLPILWLAMAIPAFSQGATRCTVLDPELQGAYAGACDKGYAEGYGEAQGQAVYKGEFKAGRKHGKGVKSWPSTGDVYEGEFAEDRKAGTGTYQWGARSSSPGERYSGGYIADRRQGYGIYEWPNGDRYAGTWASDVPTGAPTRGMIARARSQAERTAAVGREGAKVCRDMRVGVATKDMIRGTVLSLAGDVIRVRIDDAGKFDHTIGEQVIKQGALVSDALELWMPCS